MTSSKFRWRHSRGGQWAMRLRANIFSDSCGITDHAKPSCQTHDHTKQKERAVPWYARFSSIALYLVISFLGSSHWPWGPGTFRIFVLPYVKRPPDAHDVHPCVGELTWGILIMTKKVPFGQGFWNSLNFHLTLWKGPEKTNLVNSPPSSFTTYGVTWQRWPRCEMRTSEISHHIFCT